jgi:hypothetical protein
VQKISRGVSYNGDGGAASVEVGMLAEQTGEANPMPRQKRIIALQLGRGQFRQFCGLWIRRRRFHARPETAGLQRIRVSGFVVLDKAAALSEAITPVARMLVTTFCARFEPSIVTGWVIVTDPYNRPNRVPSFAHWRA